MLIPYCLNIHPGESLAATCEAIERYALAVKEQVAPACPYPLGLRLSASAAAELAEPSALCALRDLLARHACYVTDINGFPYGNFHGAPVKAAVYQPDWSTPERLTYTGRLAVILAELLPAERSGNISSVPLGYKKALADQQKTVVVRQLAVVAEFLNDLKLKTGREVVLALEPEPDCCLESVDDVIAWYEDELLVEGRRWLTANRRRTADEAEALLRRYVGVCLDTCHMAVIFEDPLTALNRYASAGIRVARIQLSAALRTTLADESITQLSKFIDPVYLHQTKLRRPQGQLLAWPDLTPETLAEARKYKGCELRTHFHVPLFYNGDAVLGSTHDELTKEFFASAQKQAIPMEIESYTFDVLPPELRAADVVASLVNEYRWLSQQSEL